MVSLRGEAGEGYAMVNKTCFSGFSIYLKVLLVFIMISLADAQSYL